MRPMSTAGIIADLQSNHPERQNKALGEATSSTDPLAISALLDFIEHSPITDLTYHQRTTVVYLLSGRSWPDFVPRLLDWLTAYPLLDKLERQRTGGGLGAVALGLLAAFGDRRAFEPMRDLLRQGNEAERRIIMPALGNLGDQRAYPDLMAWLPDPALGANAVEGLYYLRDTRAVEALVGLVQERRTSQRAKGMSLHYLSKWQQPVPAAPFIPVLMSQNWTDAAHAATVLGYSAEREAATPALLEALTRLNNRKHSESGQEHVQAKMVEALGQVGDARAIPVLVAIVKDVRHPDHVRAVAGEALGQLGAIEAREALLQVIGSVRHEAATAGIPKALVMLADDALRPAYAALLRSHHPDWRIHGWMGLARLGDEGDVISQLIADATRMSSTSSEAHYALHCLADLPDGRAYAPLMQVLERIEPHETASLKHMVAALGRSRDPRMVPVVQPYLHHPDDYMKAEAISALAGIGGSSVIHPIVACMSLNEHRVIQRAGAKAMGMLKAADGMRVLLGLLNGFDTWAQREAAASIGAIGEAEGLAAVQTWQAAHGVV